MAVWKTEVYTIQYNITLLPSVNTLIARGMFCGAKYTHQTLHSHHTSHSHQHY